MQRALVSVPGEASFADFTRALRAAMDGTGAAMEPLAPLPTGRASASGPPSVAAPTWHVPTPSPDGVPDGVALVLATSGSTGAPRRVLLDADALAASAHATHARLGGAGRWVLTLPRHHVAGVQVVARSLLAGAEPVVVPPGRFDPVAVADAVRAARAGRAGRARGAPERLYGALVPTQLHRIVAAAGSALPPELRPLADLDAVLIGGAAASPALMDRARALGLRVVATYGMTETAGGCVYDGVPLDGVRVRLGAPADADADADADGPLGHGPLGHGPLGHGPLGHGPLGHGPLGHGPHLHEATRLGVVHLAGPVLARGYLPADPDAFVVVDGVRWFRTADLGELVGGVLHVHGRADDIIISGGVNVAPTAVEAVLATLGLAALGIGEVCVVGVPDPEWGAIVTAVVVPATGVPGDSVAPDLAFLHDAVAERLGSSAAPRALVLVDRLPYRGPGKVDRTTVTREAAALVEGTHED